MTLLTPERIQELLDCAGIGIEAKFVDDIYAQIDKEWLSTYFVISLRSFIELYNIRYSKNGFDCDNYARTAANWADILHLNTPNAPKAGIAIGEFCYTMDSGGGHAVNVAICNNGEVVFFEPQTQKIIILSDDEKWNALDCRF